MVAATPRVVSTRKDDLALEYQVGFCHSMGLARSILRAPTAWAASADVSPLRILAGIEDLVSNNWMRSEKNIHRCAAVCETWSARDACPKIDDAVVLLSLPSSVSSSTSDWYFERTSSRWMARQKMRQDMRELALLQVQNKADIKFVTDWEWQHWHRNLGKPSVFSIPPAS